MIFSWAREDEGCRLSVGAPEAGGAAGHGEDMRAIRAENGGGERLSRVLEDEGCSRTIGAPEAGASILRGREELGPVGAENSAVNQSLMVRQDSESFLVLDAPDLSGVVGGDDDEGSIGTGCGGRPAIGIDVEEGRRGIAMNAPDADGAVVRRGEDLGSI